MSKSQRKHALGVSTEKWCTNWKLRIMFYSADKTEDWSLGHSLSDKLRRGNRWWGWIFSDFCNKDQVVGTSKDYCYLKKSRHLKLRNLALFYVREDASLGSLKSSFGMHLSYLGPVFCAFSSWVSESTIASGGSCSVWWFDGGHPVSRQSSLQGSPLGRL